MSRSTICTAVSTFALSRGWYARRQNRGAVMRGEILIGRMHHRLVVARRRDARFQIVGHDQRRHAADIFEHPHMTPDPIRQRLRPRRLRVDHVTGAERTDKDLCLARGTGRRLDDRHRRPRVVDEGFVAGHVHLAEHRLDGRRPVVIPLTELRVLIARRLALLGPRSTAAAVSPLCVSVPPASRRNRARGARRSAAGDR